MNPVQIKPSEIEVPHTRGNGPLNGADESRIDRIRGTYKRDGWRGLPLVVHETKGGEPAYHAWTGRHRLLAAKSVDGFMVTAVVLPEAAVQLCYDSFALAENCDGKHNQPQLRQFEGSQLPHFVMHFEDKLKHNPGRAIATAKELIVIKAGLTPEERKAIQAELKYEKGIVLARFRTLLEEGQLEELGVAFNELIGA